MVFDVVNGLLQALVGFSPTVLYLLTGVFTMLETSALVGLLVPGDAVVLLAGTTATSPTRFVALVAVALAGSLAGETIGPGGATDVAQRLQHHCSAGTSRPALTPERSIGQADDAVPVGAASGIR